MIVVVPRVLSRMHRGARARRWHTIAAVRVGRTQKKALRDENIK